MLNCFSLVKKKTKEDKKFQPRIKLNHNIILYTSDKKRKGNKLRNIVTSKTL